MHTSRKRKQPSSAPQQPIPESAHTLGTLKVDTTPLRDGLEVSDLPAVLIQEIISYLVPTILRATNIIEYEHLGAALWKSCTTFQKGGMYDCVVIRNLNLSLMVVLYFTQVLGNDSSSMKWMHEVYGDVSLLNVDAWRYILSAYPCVDCLPTGMEYILPRQMSIQKRDRGMVFNERVPEKIFLESLVRPFMGDQMELFLLRYPIEKDTVDVLCHFSIKRH